MKKFGFGKKSEGEDDSNRNALFGSRKTKAAADPSSNPYAQQNAGSDPYAQNDSKYAPSPYQQARQQYTAPGGGLPSGPGANRGAYGGPPAVNRDPAPNRDPASNGGRYGADRYGSGGGYGANRYEPPPPSYRSDAGSIRPGGYGGLGRTNSNDTTTTDDNRNELFGGAQERYNERAAQGPPNGRQGGYGAPPDNSGAGGGNYGAYGEDRQLTAEEEEEEDINATKQQIRFMKQEDVSSTRNALRIAQQAEESGRATLARLGAQGERLHNTEKNLDIAANHNRIAEERAKELKTLNRSMFAVHVANPFTAASRRAKADEAILNKHLAEREQREATRKAQFNSQQRMETAFKDLSTGPSGRPPQSKSNLAERSKYQFEADSEDEEMENEIDNNLDLLGHAAGRLNALARATGQEVDAQNKLIDRINDKSDGVDTQIAMNSARLARFK